MPMSVKRKKKRKGKGREVKGRKVSQGIIFVRKKSG